MPSIVTTMWADDDPVWNARTTLVSAREHTTLIRFLGAFWRASRHADCVVVVGSVGFSQRYRDLIAVAFLKLRRRRPAVVVTDATWEVGSTALRRRIRSERLIRAVVRRGLPLAVDGGHVTYCVLSTAELTSLPTTWRIDAARVVFTPFTTTMWGHLDDTTSDGGFIFAGGDSLRDYDILLDAAAGVNAPVRVATNVVPSRPLPSNVTMRPETGDDYDALLRAARVVVVPLKNAVRSAGQQTYLNAMALGKPVIVTDTPGVRDYIDDGINGLVVPADADALRAAIEWTLDPANAPAVAAITARARQTARERFTPDRYRARLLEVADAAIARRRS